MKRPWRRVAAPDSSSRSPVAKGSSVPACPVRAPVRRRTAATIANEDGPAGLSARMIPLGVSDRGGTLELLDDEPLELVEGQLAREPGGLRMPSPAALARDLGDVDLVDRGAQRDAVQ